MKVGSYLRNLLGIACTKLYLDSFRFDILISRCLGGQFFTRHKLFLFRWSGGCGSTHTTTSPCQAS